MRFHFLAEESKVHDFLYFPRIVHFRGEYEEAKAKSTYVDTLDREYLNFLKKSEEHLLPFKEEISEFYYPEFSCEHDFIELLSWGTGLIGFADERSYLNDLERLSANEITRHILGAMAIKVANSPRLAHARERTAELMADPSKIRGFIKELPIEAGTKWNLSLALDDPPGHTRRYVELMERLLPAFEQIYEPYQERVKAYGEYLEKTINEGGAQAIEDLTYSIFNPAILPSDQGDLPLLVSAASSYGITIALGREHPHLVWGLKAEEAFRKIKELNENKILERVTVFKNLGDKTRYEVLKLIAAGVDSGKEIAERLGVTSATVSYHINNLNISKILRIGDPNEKSGHVVNYEFITGVLEELKKDLGF